MGAASCFSDIERDIPAPLLDGLEKGSYGRAFLERLDADLNAPKF